MKRTFRALLAVLGLAAVVVLAERPGGGPARLQARTAQPPEGAPKGAEPLPEYPAEANSRVTPLNPEKTFLLEVRPDNKGRRVAFATEVCLREGRLEVFVCKKGTKEHEAILRVDLDARRIHAALTAAGAEPGSPPQFVNPKTEKPEYKPATGTKVRVGVHYRKDGRLHTHPAQEWVWNANMKKPLGIDWVFAGSQLIRDPDDPKVPPVYGANSGEVISVSNFPYSMLELPIEIGKDDASLEFEARTERIPPLFSRVWVILEPVLEKK